MASPVGEDNWVNYVDHQLHGALDLEKRVQIVESFRKAVAAEPGSLKVWMAYCEYFWSLYADCQRGSDAGWPADDQHRGREIFTLDAALRLWQEGYEAVQYRLSDSHELWNRWVSLEMELLARSVTEPGIRRITHLFRDRLAVPHATWDNTSQMFSTFLSQHNAGAYEYEMQEATKKAQDAKRLYHLREPFEGKLNAALQSADAAQIKTAMSDYLDWEVRGVKQSKKEPLMNLRICFGLFSRALTGPLASDSDTWQNYLVLISTLHSDVKAKRTKIKTIDLPKMLDVHQRAVHHVPWCGPIWARYILAAEEAGLSFTAIERIKHGATNSGHLDRDGMEAVLDMYSAWCGYLKRTAMNPTATEEAVDLAEVGLPTALEDVKHWGKRQYGDEYRGDPTFRLEKIYIQFLTEKKDDIEGARAIWEQLSTIDIHAKSYDFWLNWFLWEMVVFGSAKNKTRSPTPHTLAQGLRTPSFATRVFEKALHVKDMDWPERIMEVYLKHCNDYELAETLREAQDTIYKTRKGVAKRREREKRQLAEQQAAYAAQMQNTPAPSSHDQVMADAPPADTEFNAKRKRAPSVDQGRDGDELASKRPKSESGDAAELKRDRENTSVFISNLPDDVTITRIKKFFKGYGHINNVMLNKEPGAPPVAHVELSSPEDVQSALLRDGKYFDQNAKETVHVSSATGCTLYVANYPPDFFLKDIRALFEDCGEIHSVRFPSLIANARRRFCYITFRDHAFAEAATKLDGKSMRDGSKLVAKYSDPPGRSGRTGPQAEERELHVVHIPYGMTEDEIKQMFSKTGTVVDVRLIRNLKRESTGTAFVVMESKEQAQEAIKTLDKAVIEKRVLKVELSKPPRAAKVATNNGPANISNGASPESADSLTVAGSPAAGEASVHHNNESPIEVRRRQVVMMNIPDTMNVDQLRRLLAPIEPITRLTLYPQHSGAIAELKDHLAAARAALVVQGMEIEGTGGRRLRVGAHRELFEQEPETRIDRVDQASGKAEGSTEKKKTAAELMPPPPPVVRPSMKPVSVNRPTLGRGGKRGGLAISGAIHKKLPVNTNTNGTPATNGTTGSSGGGKSNADFKKLFLSGGKEENEHEKGEAKREVKDDAKPEYKEEIKQEL
ncbi:hypothetical protein V8F06_001640 [Rhypophila decipiens]